MKILVLRQSITTADKYHVNILRKLYRFEFINGEIQTLKIHS